MATDQESADKSIYARTWDDYVKYSNDYANMQWPGDEWGAPETWEQLFQQLFVPAGVHTWRRAVEIGPGSGKYTLKVLENSPAVVRGYDVSAEFMRICERRCEEFLNEQRLSLHLLDTARPDMMLSDLEAVGWHRTLDAFFSIDAMVHVDLQYLIVYLLTAGLVLRPGGKLILTLADATTPLGFSKILEDIAWTFPGQNGIHGGGAKFEWLGPDIVRSLLVRFGFSLDVLFNAQRDMYVLATLVAPELTENLRQYVRPGSNGG